MSLFASDESWTLSTRIDFSHSFRVQSWSDLVENIFPYAKDIVFCITHYSLPLRFLSRLKSPHNCALSTSVYRRSTILGQCANISHITSDSTQKPIYQHQSPWVAPHPSPPTPAVQPYQHPKFPAPRTVSHPHLTCNPLFQMQRLPTIPNKFCTKSPLSYNHKGIHLPEPIQIAESRMSLMMQRLGTGM